MIKPPGARQQQENMRFWRVRTIFILWLTYVVFYVGRVNMAVAIPVLQESLGWSSSQAGLIPGLFFWVYAFGQLINGQLGDHYSSRWFVFWGLLGTALMNGLFGLGGSFFFMAGAWAVNGYFQSMGWGPIVRTAALWTESRHRSRVSVILGTSFLVGSVLSWLMAGQLIKHYGHWQLLFSIPALALAAMALVWVVYVRNNPADAGLTAKHEMQKRGGQGRTSLLEHGKKTAAYLRQPYFITLALVAMIQGMIKDGLTLWAPTIIMETQGLDIARAVPLSLMVPTFGMMGIFLGGWLYSRLKDESKTMLLLFAMGLICCVFLLLVMPLQLPLLFGVVMGLCSMLVYGINVLLMSIIPIRLAFSGRSSSVAGFLDFSSYVGAGIMAVVTGVALRYLSWPQIFAAWAALNTTGVFFTLSNRRKLENRENGDTHSNSNRKRRDKSV